MTPLSERQQVKLLLQSTAPTTVTALSHPAAEVYLSWTPSRRRAWDRRHVTPNAYFFHYLHPAFTAAPKKWSLAEHHAFLRALSIANLECWGVFSLLLPGRVGSECRRYYHRIGRAGFIHLDGSVRYSLTATAKILDGNRVVKSKNSLFRRRSLKKFIPKQLPDIDDTLYKSLETPRKTPMTAVGNHKRRTGDKAVKPPKQSQENNSEKASSSVVSLHAAETQDLLTYVPPTPSDYAGKPFSDNNRRDRPPIASTPQKSQAVYCRLRVRDDTNNSSPRSNHNSEVSCTRKTRTGSVKLKLRMKSTPASAKDSQSAKTRQKRKQATKPPSVRRLGKKTLKNDEDKENVAPGQPQQSRGVISRNPKKTGRAKCLRESRKQAEGNNGKQSGTEGLPPTLDRSLAGDETANQNKSGKPLKPILKSKGNATKRRENTRTVHFSPMERQSKESRSRNAPVPKEDIIPERKKPKVPSAPKEDVAAETAAPTNRLLIDRKVSDQSEIDPKIDKFDDLSRRTLGVHADASENQTGTTRLATQQQVTASTSPLVNSSESLGNGASGQLSSQEKVPAENTPISSNVIPRHMQTPLAHDVAIQSRLEHVHVPPATELDTDLTSDHQGGSMPSTIKTTTEPLHVGSILEDSENRCFEDKSQKRVETVHLEHSSSGTESQSTRTDGEFLDMEVEMATPPRDEGEKLDETSEPASKLRNPRRVTGPTRGDRTSIGFLMNGEDAEPVQKKRRLGADGPTLDGDVYDRSEFDASPISSDRDETLVREKECEDSLEAKGTTVVRNDLVSKDKSEYHLIQTRVEQTRLMLSLFIDMVDPIGEQLGHKGQRVKLLESFDESLQWLQFAEGQVSKKRPLPIPPFLRAAKTAFQLDTGNTVKHCRVHVEGLSRYWGAFVDSYIQRLKDMEAYQNADVQSKRLSSTIF